MFEKDNVRLTRSVTHIFWKAKQNHLRGKPLLCSYSCSCCSSYFFSSVQTWIVRDVVQRRVKENANCSPSLLPLFLFPLFPFLFRPFPLPLVLLLPLFSSLFLFLPLPFHSFPFLPLFCLLFLLASLRSVPI